MALRSAIVVPWVVAAALLAPLALHAAAGASLQEALQADWAAQERRLGRAPHSPEAIRDSLDRADKLLDDLARLDPPLELAFEKTSLQRLREEASEVASLGEEGRLRLYHRIRTVTREAALKNPLLAGRPIVFLQRHRFISQMLHEYLGYFYDYGDIAGGGVYVLEEPGRSLKTRDLIRGRLPKGNYTTLALSYDAKTVYFAFCPRAPEKPDYYSPQRRSFHLFAMDADGANLRQLTDGPNDDFDPCPLPDGGLAFMSTRRGGFGRCHNPWEPLPTYTLHRLDLGKGDRHLLPERPEGCFAQKVPVPFFGPGRIRALSLHETNEWHPSVLADGRIVYSRWDYVDRSAANYHGLWVTNPDGTGPQILFGNYTDRINACFQARAIPGSRRVCFVAGAHHAVVGGSLVIVDPAAAALDPKTGLDRFESIETLTPEVCFPEAPGWPKSYFHSPWPLAESYYLVSFSFQPLPGMGPGVKDDNPTGLYYLDRFGNLELLYRDVGISSMYPIPLVPRPVPPVIPSTLDSTGGMPSPGGMASRSVAMSAGEQGSGGMPSRSVGMSGAGHGDASDAMPPGLGDEGEFVLADVRQSLMPLPPGRRITSLRVFQVLPKTETHVANQPRLGYANAESARMFLGTVPVEADGSAYFRVPARKPVYFQAVDASGRAVQTMRSLTYLQPGERRSCVGCHERPGTAPPPRQLLATGRPPSTIAPGPVGTQPFSFPVLVQPVLDRHCTRCHDDAAGAPSPLVLTGGLAGSFSRAYESLRPFVRWYEWGGKSISQAVTLPGHGGADESRLLEVLSDKDHKDQVRLPDEDRLRVILWLDANAPFYGTYSQAEQAAQRRGKAVPPPGVQ